MIRLGSYESLRDFVRQTLCDRADLDTSVPIVEHLLKRKGKVCGVEFTMIAPRSVRLSAIWDPRTSRIYFYDQQVERFQCSSVVGLSIEHIPDRIAIPEMTTVWRGK